MALPDDHEDPDEHAAGPLLPPEDRLWRHPSELVSHPLSPISAPTGPPPAHGSTGSFRGALALVCLTGVVLVAGALWVTWPRQTSELAGMSNGTSVDDPPSGLPNHVDPPPVTVTNTSTDTRLFGLLAPSASDHPEVSRARLGVQVIDLSVPPVGFFDSWDTTEVVEIERGSAAERSGLLAGDLITAVGGHQVGSAAELIEAVTSHEPGDEVEVTVIRRGDLHSFEVRLGR